MTYVVLARKYRPRVFAELVGQAHVVQALSNALIQQRLHHAYLFTGTRGVGKTTIARILAKSLNCVGADGQGGITAEPCGVCNACRDIDAGRHVDYVELDAASNRGVDEISQLLDQAVYKPVVGRFKVYMIDEVHMLSTTAFNAMLKTLEEPPEYLKFVLATTDPQKVPVTVLSRCLQFNLRPMAPETVQEHLLHVLASEGIDNEAGALRLLARAARGSMRDALSLSDQAIAFGGGRLEEATVRQMLGAVDRGHAVRIIEAVAGGDGAALLAQVDELRERGLSAAGTLEELMRLAQEMAVLQALPQALDEGDPDAAEAARLAGLMAADETQLLYSVALHGRGELGLAPDEYSGLTMVLLRLLAFRPGGPLAPREAGAAGAGGASAGSASASPRSAGLSNTPAVARASTAVPQARTGSAAPVPRPADPEASAAPRAVPPMGPQGRSGAVEERGAGAGAASSSRRVAAPASAPAMDPGSRGQAPASRQPPPWEDLPAPAAADVSDALPAQDDEPPPWIDEGPDDGAVPADITVAPPRRDDAPAAALPALEPGEATGRWIGLLEPLWQAGAVTALARELSWQAQCLEVPPGAGAGRWVLRVSRETLRQDAVRDRLQAALTQACEAPVELRLEVGEVRDSAALRDAHARARAQAEAEQAIRSDPLVVALLGEFRTARIVPGSVRPL